MSAVEQIQRLELFAFTKYCDLETRIRGHSGKYIELQDKRTIVGLFLLTFIIT